MKLLWFTLTPCGATSRLNADSPGGGWLSALEDSLTRTGNVELHICFHWEADVPPFTTNGVTYHPVRRFRTKEFILGYLFGGRFRRDPVPVYSEVIERVNPDLIHVHGTEEAFGLIQSITKVPVVISLQGILTIIYGKLFTGISCFRFLLHERIKDHVNLKSVLSTCLIFRAHCKRERKILSMAQHVIGRTEWDRRCSRLLAPTACYYQGNEILRPVFYEVAWNAETFSAPLRLVTVTSDAPYKGFEALLTASRILRKEAGIDFRWSVIGIASDDPVVNVAQRWLGVQENVELLGKKTAIEIRDILLESDIYCQVSHIENSPNSLCEAMITGMPIVATFAGGTDSLLCHGKEGVLVQDGDPWSMAGAIVQMAGDFSKAATLARAARTRAMVRHNPESVIRDLLKTYTTALSQYRSSLHE
jgi:glycosyltransferase involved in cell wall biosynthesis